MLVQCVNNLKRKNDTAGEAMRVWEKRVWSLCVEKMDIAAEAMRVWKKMDVAAEALHVWKKMDVAVETMCVLVLTAWS